MAPDLLTKGWDLNEGVCPCDIHLLEFLRQFPERLSVLHMGTGLHHTIGLQYPGEVLGITASLEEFERFTGLQEQHPDPSYHVRHGDIYHMDFATSGPFDVISLPHIGEFHPSGPDEGVEFDLLMRLSERLKAGGMVVFYDGSYAQTWEWLRQQIAKWSDVTGFRKSAVFKSLSIYTKP